MRTTKNNKVNSCNIISGVCANRQQQFIQKQRAHLDRRNVSEEKCVVNENIELRPYL